MTGGSDVAGSPQPHGEDRQALTLLHRIESWPAFAAVSRQSRRSPGAPALKSANPFPYIEESVMISHPLRAAALVLSLGVLLFTPVNSPAAEDPDLKSLQAELAGLQRRVGELKGEESTLRSEAANLQSTAQNLKQKAENLKAKESQVQQSAGSLTPRNSNSARRVPTSKPKVNSWTRSRAA